MIVLEVSDRNKHTSLVVITQKRRLFWRSPRPCQLGLSGWTSGGHQSTRAGAVQKTTYAPQDLIWEPQVPAPCIWRRSCFLQMQQYLLVWHVALFRAGGTYRLVFKHNFGTIGFELSILAQVMQCTTHPGS